MLHYLRLQKMPLSLRLSPSLTVQDDEADEKRFEEFKLQRMSDGKLLGDGVLIFDEVKVVCCLMWNSQCQKIIGLAMSSYDLASLQDIYQLIECDAKTHQTSYIICTFFGGTSQVDLTWWDHTLHPAKPLRTRLSFPVCWKVCETFTFMDSKLVCWCVMQPVLMFQQ